MTLIKSVPPLWTSFSDFFDDDWIKTRFRGSENSPAINVIDNEDNFEVEAIVPGFTKDDIHVAIENGVLTISGKTEKEESEKDKNYTRKEYSYRSFSQSFTLPENIDDDDVKAKYENGILHLTLNKSGKILPPKKDIRIE